MNLSKRSTIKQVAKAAGVSTQTVSRVINDRPDVAPETRQRIQQVIERLGYQPSALARSLIQQRSYTLGVVTAGLRYLGPSRTLSGIVSKAEELGYALLLKELPRFDTEDIVSLVQDLLARHVDGIVWAAPQVGENRRRVSEMLSNAPVPVVFLTMEPQPGLSIVTYDNFMGGQIAAAHLLQQGYRHIGHISGPLDWWESRQRKAGWRAALEKAGLPAAEHQCVEGNWSSASGEAAFRQLLTQYPEMEAVFVGNDQMALSVMQLACRNGINVPGRLGVVGFDGLPESAYYWPPLTTMVQDQSQLGCTVVEEIVQVIETLHTEGRPAEGRPAEGRPPSPRTIILQPELLVRESSNRLKS